MLMVDPSVQSGLMATTLYPAQLYTCYCEIIKPCLWRLKNAEGGGLGGHLPGDHPAALLRHRVKRLVKTPKVYFLDVGTLCHLTGLKDPEHAAAGAMVGAIFETGALSVYGKAIWYQ